MERLNEQQAKQIIMNAQMASYPARDVPQILKPLYGYVEDTEKEIAALKAENERLRAERDVLLGILKEDYERKLSKFKNFTHFCDNCKQSYESKIDVCENCSSKNIIEYPF